MSSTGRVRSSDVTLGDKARAGARRHGIGEHALRLARALGASTHETPEYLVVVATLPDRRRVQLFCCHARPAHIVKLRLE